MPQSWISIFMYKLHSTNVGKCIETINCTCCISCKNIHILLSIQKFTHILSCFFSAKEIPRHVFIFLYLFKLNSRCVYLCFHLFHLQLECGFLFVMQDCPLAPGVQGSLHPQSHRNFPTSPWMLEPPRFGAWLQQSVKNYIFKCLYIYTNDVASKQVQSKVMRQEKICIIFDHIYDNSRLVEKNILTKTHAFWTQLHDL